jgi:hypothetical protein
VDGMLSYAVGERLDASKVPGGRRYGGQHDGAAILPNRLNSSVAQVTPGTSAGRGHVSQGLSVSLVATSDRELVALTAFLSYTVLAGDNAVCIRFSNRELAL